MYQMSGSVEGSSVGGGFSEVLSCNSFDRVEVGRDILVKSSVSFW